MKILINNKKEFLIKDLTKDYHTEFGFVKGWLYDGIWAVSNFLVGRFGSFVFGVWGFCGGLCCPGRRYS